MKSFLFLSIIIIFTGCALSSHYNKRFSENNAEKACTEKPYEGKATKIIKEQRGNPDVLMILSLSGGGSRAAYFSGIVMLELEKNGLLSEVDVITSVSGGSLPAAYYAISVDREDPNLKNVASGRIWDEKNVKDLMKENYLRKWIANWFWPDNIFYYWFTSYDRSDIMAQTFADNMYDVKHGVRDLKFEDINKKRPYLIINSTDATDRKNCSDPYYTNFTFTHDDFCNKINSNIQEFEIAKAVMASAAFPGVFNYVTLKNFNFKDEERFVHVFDAGTLDNLGLSSVEEIIRINDTGFKKYKHIIVLLVDAYADPKLISEKKYDSREYMGRFLFDRNILNSVDSILSSNRKLSIEKFFKFKNEDQFLSKKLYFWHIQFEDVENYCNSLKKEESINECLRQSKDLRHKIPTTFKISKKDCLNIDWAVTKIFETDAAKENISNIKGYLDESN